GIAVDTPQEAEHAVDSLADAGVDFIKAYEMLRHDAWRAVLDEARRRGIRVAGHLPLAVSAFEASERGEACLEHLRNFELECSSRADSLRAARTAELDSSVTQTGATVRARIFTEQRPTALDTEDPARRDSLLRALARDRTWQCPTIFLDEGALILADSVAFG